MILFECIGGKESMKLLASDFDGTLLLHPHQGDNIILKSDKEAIRKFQNAGYLFGICTGRGLDGIVKWSEDIEFDFYITNSGAVIYDKNQQVIESHYLYKNQIEKIMNHFDEKICCTFVCNGKMYVKNPNKKYPSQIETVTSLDDFPDEFEAFSMHFQDDIEKTAQIKKEIELYFGNQVAIYQNIDNLDMCALGCSKGNGIKSIQHYFHLQDKDIYAIGDSWNDIPMFEACQNSFTFLNSPVDVKEKTKYQVDTIAMCIEQIMGK